MSHLKGNFNVKDFESACGVGITVSPEDIEHVVENLIKKHRDELLDKRYTENTTLGLIFVLSCLHLRFFGVRCSHALPSKEH